jgi:hypothetical protein
MWKKLGIAVAVLLLLIAGGAYYLFSNLDGFIKQAIQTYGTAATQATVSVDGVKLSLTDGAGALNGLTLGNPAGFSSPQAISVGQVAVQVDTGSITGTGPIIIDEISVAAPHVTYEVAGLGRGSNLDAIKQNVNDYVAAQSSGPSTSANRSARKEIIRDLTITGGDVTLASSLLGGRSVTVPLPPIHLTNIGGSSGASPAEIAQKVLGAITSKAASVGSSALTASLGGASGLAGRAAGGVGGLLKGF